MVFSKVDYYVVNDNEGGRSNAWYNEGEMDGWKQGHYKVCWLLPFQIIRMLTDGIHIGKTWDISWWSTGHGRPHISAVEGWWTNVIMALHLGIILQLPPRISYIHYYSALTGSIDSKDIDEMSIHSQLTSGEKWEHFQRLSCFLNLAPGNPRGKQIVPRKNGKCLLPSLNMSPNSVTPFKPAFWHNCHMEFNVRYESTTPIHLTSSLISMGRNRIGKLALRSYLLTSSTSFNLWLVCDRMLSIVSRAGDFVLAQGVAYRW